MSAHLEHRKMLPKMPAAQFLKSQETQDTLLHHLQPIEEDNDSYTPHLVPISHIIKLMLRLCAQSAWRSSQTRSKVLLANNPAQFHILLLTSPEQKSLCLHGIEACCQTDCCKRGCATQTVELCRFQPRGLQPTSIWRQKSVRCRGHSLV